jgi:hypothetical protein
MTVFGGKGEGKVHPLRHIYYLKILGGRDIMDNDDKGVFNQKRWLVHILKDPGLQPLRNPQKQGAILDVITNPKITLGLTRGG